MASNPIVISRRSNLWERTIAQWVQSLGVLRPAIVAAVLFVAMGSLYLYQVSFVERQIDEMVRLEKDLTELNQYNNELSVSIAGYEDMSRIKTEARAMGLGEAAHVEYLEVELDGSAAQGRMVPGVPASSGGVAQPSAWLEDQTVQPVGGSWITSTIMQQFRGWISRDTAAPGAR